MHRRLLEPNNFVLQSLGEHIPFEIAVGMNGRVWVNTSDIDKIIIVTNAILKAEHLSKKEIQILVQKLLDTSAS